MSVVYVNAVGAENHFDFLQVMVNGQKVEWSSGQANGQAYVYDDFGSCFDAKRGRHAMNVVEVELGDVEDMRVLDDLLETRPALWS